MERGETSSEPNLASARRGVAAWWCVDVLGVLGVCIQEGRCVGVKIRVYTGSVYVCLSWGHRQTNVLV